MSALSPTMRECIAFAKRHGGRLVRSQLFGRPGKYGGAENWNRWNTATIQALVDRGVMRYGNGEATLTEEHDEK